MVDIDTLENNIYNLLNNKTVNKPDDQEKINIVEDLKKNTARKRNTSTIKSCLALLKKH